MTTPTDTGEPAADRMSRTSRAALLLACVAVGLAVRVDGGNYHPAAVALVAVSLIAALVGMVPARFGPLEAVPARWAATAAAVALLAEVATAFLPRLVPTSEDAGSIVPVRAFLIGCWACVVPAILWAGRRSPAADAWAAPAKIAFPLGLVLHFAAGVAAIGAVPYPVFDFYVVQALAGERLLDGGNPYAMTFPDLSGGTTPHWHPSLMAGGQLLFGFLYPPLSLFCLLPVQFFGGDFRYVHAAAFAAAGALIGYCRPGPWPKLAAALFLLTPAGMLIVAGGWTESLVALMLALTVFVACRRPAAAGGALGLWWAVKQYVPLTAPLALLLAGRPLDRVRLLRTLAGAVVVGAVVTLPLALWDFRAFWHSAVAVQLRQPFRPDALSFPAALYAATGVTLPAWVAFVALGAVQALALWRCPRTPAGFAAATACALLAFFALGKQAFANYYFLVAAALAAAAAAGSAGAGAGAGAGTPETGFDVRPSDAARSQARAGESKRSGRARRT